MRASITEFMGLVESDVDGTLGLEAEHTAPMSTRRSTVTVRNGLINPSYSREWFYLVIGLSGGQRPVGTR